MYLANITTIIYVRYIHPEFPDRFLLKWKKRLLLFIVHIRVYDNTMPGQSRGLTVERNWVFVFRMRNRRLN